jgi:Sec-independent protein translocase protein TatA
MDFFGIGSGELILILVIALLLFKPATVVDWARTVGKTIKAIKKTTSDITSNITREIEEEKTQVMAAENKNPPPPENP